MEKTLIIFGKQIQDINSRSVPVRFSICCRLFKSQNFYRLLFNWSVEWPRFRLTSKRFLSYPGESTVSFTIMDCLRRIAPAGFTRGGTQYIPVFTSSLSSPWKCRWAKWRALRWSKNSFSAENASTTKDEGGSRATVAG